MILRALDCFGTEPIHFPEFFFFFNSERNDEYKEREIVSEVPTQGVGTRKECKHNNLRPALSYLDSLLSLDCQQFLNPPFPIHYRDTSRLYP